MNSKKNAIIISIIIILLLAGSLLTIYLMNAQSENGRYAYIYQNGSLIKTIDLSSVEEAYTFTVTGDNQCYNVIRVRNGSIGIIEASCPDGLCRNMGFISTSALPITCLPNHLVIELSGEGNEIDGVLY